MFVVSNSCAPLNDGLFVWTFCKTQRVLVVHCDFGPCALQVGEARFLLGEGEGRRRQVFGGSLFWCCE